MARNTNRYVLYIDGIPESRSLNDLREIARRVQRDPQWSTVRLYVQDWSTPNGLRLIKDYPMIRARRKNGRHR